MLSFPGLPDTLILHLKRHQNLKSKHKVSNSIVSAITTLDIPKKSEEKSVQNKCLAIYLSPLTYTHSSNTINISWILQLIKHTAQK